jgi:membrane protease YdiL (CAAX protease family)
LLWFAVVLVAPVTEELFVRGFLFQGVVRSRLGPVGAIVLSSLAWAVMHTQYDLFGIGTIVLGGLLLGYARLRSQSLYVPIAMHIVQNIVATAEVMIYTLAT